jgi:hypothetical protein
MRIIFTGAVLIAAAGTALAAPFDGRWSVLLVTESGACDVYRVNVQVVDGRVMSGEEGPQIRGTVSSKGMVRLTTAYGNDTATAQGTAVGKTAQGRWSVPTRACAGRWQAEKRG